MSPYRLMLIMPALLLTALSACTTVTVRSDSAAAGDIGSCRSYAWYEPAADERRPMAFRNPINDQRLRGAIAKRLTARGLTVVDAPDAADCLVGYAIGSRNNYSEFPASRFSFGFGTGWGWGRSAFSSMYWDDFEPYRYREGRISVDMYKRANREPIWHAEAHVDVTRLTGAAAEMRIDEAVAAIFAKYPGSAR